MTPLRSLRAKLTGMVVVGVLLPIVVAFGLVAFREVRSVEHDVIAQSSLIAQLASGYAAADLAFASPEDGRKTLQKLSAIDEVIFAAIYDRDGKLFCAYRRDGIGGALGTPDATITGSPEFEVRSGPVYADVFKPVTFDGSRFGTLHARLSKETLAHRSRTYLLTVLWVAVALAVFTLAFAYSLQRLISRPILDLSEVAKRITQNADYSVRARNTSNDEIGVLSGAFNTMMAEVQRRQEDLRLSEDALKKSYEQLARTQKELVQKERLAAVGELAAVMAHEVRNPLGVVFNSLETLRRKWSAPEEVQLLLNIVREEADRLDRIVEDLLDFARPHPPTLKLHSIQQIMHSALEVALCKVPREKYRVCVDADGAIPAILLDERMIRQALINLLVNAVQAMPAGGEFALRATQDQGAAGRPLLRIEVADRGPGISAQTAARLFQPFFTTKATGTGLGLAVVRHFVNAHQGEVQVHSREGEGTTFTILLPISGATNALSA